MLGMHGMQARRAKLGSAARDSKDPPTAAPQAPSGSGGLQWGSSGGGEAAEAARRDADREYAVAIDGCIVQARPLSPPSALVG